MKTTHLLPVLLIVLGACTGKSKQQGEIDDPQYQLTADNTSKQSTMKGFETNIEKETTDNSNFRKVLYTGQHMQLVLMSLKPGEEIGEETHLKSDQFFRFESGTGRCIVSKTTYEVKAGDVVIVPSGAKHNVINTDATHDLKMYTIYAQPNHKDGIVRTTKEDATKREEKFDGKTTE